MVSSLIEILLLSNLLIDMADESENTTFNRIFADNDVDKDYLKQNKTIEHVNIFDNRVDDCSATEWIPFFDLHIDPLLFADLVSI